jgi:hypothetical protein
MLNGGTLENSQITVSSQDTETPELANVKPTQSTAQTHAEKEGHDIDQEGQSGFPVGQAHRLLEAKRTVHLTDKPRSAVAAEYLAHGYALSDSAIEKAIAADQRAFIFLIFCSAHQKLVLT